MHHLPLPSLPRASAFALCAASCLCPGARAQTSWVDVTDAAGVAHTHQTPAWASMGLMIGGATVGDFNGDGWPDLFVPSGGVDPDKLFINQQDGTFVDEAAAWGVDRVHIGSAATVGDFDGDGWQDLYVTSHGFNGNETPGCSLLYHNLGNGTFEQIGREAGVAWTSLMPDGFDGAFGDYDLDGDLDLFVANYDLTGLGNRMFRNDGDGSFTEVTRECGIDARAVHGFTPGFSDMDGDRYPELILVGDTGTSRYYINNGDGTFTDHTAQVPALDEPNAMGLAIGDVNGDGLLDFYMSDSYWPLTGEGGNRLFINQGGHQYVEDSRNANVYECGWGWGVVALDLDNDGHLDLAGTNGYPGLYDDYPTKVFHNQGDGTFVETGQATGLDNIYDGRGILRLDYDRDGDCDLLVSSSNDPLKLYRNDLANANAWLKVGLDTTAHPGVAPMGFGARLEATVGTDTFVRYVDSRKSFLGQSEMLAHFGLGSAAVVDELRVLWPDGFSTVLRDVAVNQHLTVAAAPPLAHDPLQRGTTAELRVAGADPGSRVDFLLSETGLGEGPVRDKFDNVALGILAPLHLAGTTTADSEGEATVSVFIPPHAPLQDFGLQAVVYNAAETVPTNAVLSPVLP